MIDQIFAEEGQPDYDVIAPRELIFDKKLCDGSARLLLMALALLRNPRWRLTETGLATLLDRTPRQVKRYVRNLKDRHYLVIDKHRDSKGHWDGYSWTIYRRGLETSVKKNELPIFRAVTAADLPLRRAQ